MCIAILKPSGVNQPSEDVLKICFDNNNDGAGYMFVRKGLIVIRKGFMTFVDFISDYNHQRLSDKDVIGYHFRIRTDGKISKGCTHPFPIAAHENQLTRLSCNTDLAMMHNGILPIKHESHISDTMEFTMSILNDLTIRDNIHRPAIIKLLTEYIGTSKVCILDRDGRYELLGNWINDDGVFYSNDTYKESWYGSMVWTPRNGSSKEDSLWSKYFDTGIYTDNDDDEVSISNYYCPHCDKELAMYRSGKYYYYHCVDCGQWYDEGDLYMMDRKGGV